ncbi:MAG: hypothetical protein H7329_08010 [Opitutaceae bacterium]|nr:hypothetical protein [Cytophagales bacterium]
MKIFKQLCQLQIACLFCLILGSCKSDKPVVQPETNQVHLNSASNVVVVNEGIFPFGNASISFLDGKTGQVYADIFKSTNNRDLGDVAQSAITINGRLYVVVNNSKKLEVLDKNNFHSLGTITGLSTPRYMVGVSNSKAYVSDIYSNLISVVDLNSLQITKTISCPGWTEQMIYHLGKVYVTNYWKSYLYEIDPQKDMISDSIFIGQGAQSIVADKKDRLIIACGGYKIPQADTKIVILNLSTKKPERIIPVLVNYPSSLAINGNRDSIYFLNTAVYKISIDDIAIGSPFISAQNRQYYGLGLDTRSNQVFVADAIDYVQKGKVYVYSAGGNELATFEVGINPGGFCFY